MSPALKNHDGSTARIFWLTTLAMVAFAGNSLLCRMALKQSNIDAASFTTIRILAGALTLFIILSVRGRQTSSGGDWTSAIALFVYAAAFSFAYIGLTAATGALLLFGAVQLTMIGYGLWGGERPTLLQTLGILAAIGGLIAMMLPGVNAPPAAACVLMIAAGIAWGVYSLRGRGTKDPLGATTGNFVRASVLALVMSLVLSSSAQFDLRGGLFALASGSLASGVGYAIWYSAVKGLAATSAASVQLTVPVLAAIGAVVLLGEALTLHLAITSMTVLGGVALVIFNRRQVRM